MSQSETIITVKDLIVRFDEKTVLDGISFDVHQGEVFVILGGSGCGKSTLMRHMVGLRAPQGGSINIAGFDVTGNQSDDYQKAIQKFGVMFQSGALFGSMTLLENVRLPLEEKTDLPRILADEIAAYKLRQVGLQDYLHYMPAEISGGMQKRAAIARAMALDPAIVFLDEPSAGLDPITSAKLDTLILSLSQKFGVTFVVVSHELPSIFAIADRVIMLQDGKIIAEGSPKALSESADEPFVRQFFHREAEMEVDNG